MGRRGKVAAVAQRFRAGNHAVHPVTLRKGENLFCRHVGHALHYQAEGTDLTIELPKKHVWAGAGSVNESGHEFMAVTLRKGENLFCRHVGHEFVPALIHASRACPYMFFETAELRRQHY
jgi:hypothetical protein